MGTDTCIGEVESGDRSICPKRVARCKCYVMNRHGWVRSEDISLNGWYEIRLWETETRMAEHRVNYGAVREEETPTHRSVVCLSTGGNMWTEG